MPTPYSDHDSSTKPGLGLDIVVVNAALGSKGPDSEGKDQHEEDDPIFQ